MGFEDMIADRGRHPKATQWEKSTKKMRRNMNEAPMDIHVDTDSKGFHQKHKKHMRDM